MSSIMETPHAGKSKDYEFTPIGYIEEKKGNSLDLSKENGLKRSLDSDMDVPVDKKRVRNPSIVDETFNSTRLFNDTSFDETVPEAVIQERVPNYKTNLMNDLLSNTKESTDHLTSNPLKETEVSLKKLQMENYNLRIKCTSLLKFLNNISDEGELMKNLDILDELHDLKIKHQQLSQDYLELQKRFDNADQSNAKTEEVQKLQEINATLSKQLHSTENSLSVTEKELMSLKETIKLLENKVITIRSESKDREGQLSMKVDMLQSNINELKTSLNLKEKECVDLKDKIKWLTSQLQEFDHQSGSLLELQSQIDTKNEAIRNLEAQLQRNEHQRQSLEREVSALKAELESFKQTNQTIIESKDSQIKQLTDTAASSDSDLIKRIEELSKEKLKLLDENNQLRLVNGESKSKMSVLQEELQSTKNELQSSNENRSKELERLRNKSNIISPSKELLSLRNELMQMKKANDLLKTENNSLSRRLDNLIRQSPSKKSVEVTLSKKNNEILALHSTITDLEQELKSFTSSISDLKASHRNEINKLREQLLSSPANMTEDKIQLEKKISMLQLELNSIKDTKEKEISMWSNKYEAIKRTNEELLREEKEQSGKWSSIINERDKEIQQLHSRYNQLLSDRTSLINELSKVKSHKDDYKQELKKNQSRLEFITKEFVKLKESSKTDSNLTDSSTKELNNKWFSKYQSMKNKLLSELKSLQDENLEFQKVLIKHKNDPDSNIPTIKNINKSSLQDEVDFYRLRYTNEVQQNNDLKVMNEYLNRVLRASSQHVKLDILKLENEVPLYSKYSEFPFNSPMKTSRPMKFKTVALFVLSVVRMQQTIDRRRWDKQRMDYLQRKIILNQDKISW